MNILIKPIVTEKMTAQGEDFNRYGFVVEKTANKLQIKQAVELAWPNVTVEKVRVANMPAKRSRRFRRLTVRKTGWKKAIVTLELGDSIELFEGV